MGGGGWGRVRWGGVKENTPTNQPTSKLVGCFLVGCFLVGWLAGWFAFCCWFLFVGSCFLLLLLLFVLVVVFVGVLLFCCFLFLLLFCFFSFSFRIRASEVVRG